MTQQQVAHPILACLEQIETALKDVADLDPMFMSATDKALVLEQHARVATQLEALGLRVIAAAEDAGDVADQAGVRDLATWLRNHTGVDMTAARARVRFAQSVEHDRPSVAAALREGSVSVDQARVITRAVNQMPSRDAGVSAEDETRAEAFLLNAAREHGPKQLRILGRRILEVIDPVRFEKAEARALEAEERAAEQRVSVRTRDNGDGTMHIDATLPLSDGIRFKTYLEAFAQPRKQSLQEAGKRVPYERLLGQAFQQLLQRMDPDTMPRHGGDATTVMVTIPLDQLRDDLATAGLGLGDSESISASQARRLACNGSLIPAVLGGDSEILDLGRASRLHTPMQRKAIRLRDQTCRAEGCDIPGTWADVHHLTPWAAGGETNLENAVLLCGHHHRRAHRTDQHLERLPNGRIRYHRRP